MELLFLAAPSVSRTTNGRPFSDIELDKKKRCLQRRNTMRSYSQCVITGCGCDLNGFGNANYFYRWALKNKSQTKRRPCTGGVTDL
ncbi:unnamed protein product [Toxocara canis]|uniref:Secreted protein n=1 Tax=Toxocara canis TaxID=6265 RepID=A0A183TV12_TOXCA|nr:unnamed protein product [Toxocara canis]